MKENEFLGTLLPSHPDLIPIIEAVREKYNLPEISPDDDPITEIYLGDDIIPLEEFRQEIKNRILENLAFMPPEIAKQYKSLKALIETQTLQEFELLSDELKSKMYLLLNAMKDIVKPSLSGLDAFIDNVVNMLYIYLLTGETEEAPSNWFSMVTTLTMSGEPVVFAMANQAANLDLVIQQFREEHKKNFGTYRPKITKKVLNTAYYVQLKKAGKSFDTLFGEYVRQNKNKFPRDTSSKRYVDALRLQKQNLKKRIQRTEAILDVIFRDKK